ncbi:hypothetical protein DSO57_1030075 [Entomophthora muscae]|uniref:Uncharacterized protein n=1 Tax=Entomophthora muscae TaxID=34485 RepID=A0ACC2RS12_9FUNG|nr:hypothetical protein DSO57_1030075 [Entomophthora muscae]
MWLYNYTSPLTAPIWITILGSTRKKAAAIIPCIKTLGSTPARFHTRDLTLLNPTFWHSKAKRESQLELPNKGTGTNNNLNSSATQFNTSLISKITPPLPIPAVDQHNLVFLKQFTTTI